MHGKQYSDEQNAVIRAAVREIVERDFKSTKAPAAEALGVTAASLGDFLNGKKGVGNKLLTGLARYTGQSVAMLLGEQASDDEPQWGSLPGYRESEKSLRADHPHRYSEALYKMGRRIRGAMPLEVPVTPQVLRRLLNFLEETARIEELADLEMERIEKKLAADIKRANTREANKAKQKVTERELPLKSSK